MIEQQLQVGTLVECLMTDNRGVIADCYESYESFDWIGTRIRYLVIYADGQRAHGLSQHYLVKSHRILLDE